MKARPDALLILGAALAFSGAAAVSPVTASLCALAILGLLHRRAAGWVILGAFVLWCGGCLRARAVLEGFEEARWQAREEVGGDARCAARGRVVTSPEWVYGGMRYWLAAEHLSCEGRELDRSRVLRVYGGPADLGRGDLLELTMNLGPVQLFRNSMTSDPVPPAARKGAVLAGAALSVDVLERGAGLRRLIDAARFKVRGRIVATFAPKAEALARALVLGENDLESGLNEAFKRSGLAHLLAVSGTHLVFAVVMLVRMLRAFLVRWEALAASMDVARLASLLGAGAALLYADFAGGSGSAWRAAFMLVAVFLARALGRISSVQRVLGLTLLAGAAFDPLVAFDLSFLLSLAATVGLLTWSFKPPEQATGVRGLAPVRFVEAGVRATVSALLPCIPILALMSEHLSLLGIVGNLLAGPIGEIVALPLCLLHAVASGWPWLERGLADVGSGALLAVGWVAELVAAQSAFAVPVPYPWPLQRAAALIALAGYLLCAKGSPASLPLVAWAHAAASPAQSEHTGTQRSPSRRRYWLLAGAGLLILTELYGRATLTPKGTLRITSLDVGQGDGTLVELPDGKLMLVDGGGFVGSPVDPGERVILPALRALRRTKLDIMVLSHPHPDHFLGLKAIAQRIPVGELWTTREGEAKGNPSYRELLDALRRQGTRIVYPSDLCGAPRTAGPASIEVLAPCPDFLESRSTNDNSIVLRMKQGAHVALFLGDAEAEQEAHLAQHHGAHLKASWLKAGHHGSRTSSTVPLLQHARPEVTVVSTGFRNRFGHPHSEAILRLTQHSGQVLRTDTHGSITWETDGERQSIKSYAPAAGKLAPYPSIWPNSRSREPLLAEATH